MGGSRNLITEFMSPTILWVVFIVVLLIFIAVSYALLYHWRNYNVNSALVRRLSRVYFWVSGLFLLSILISLLVYSYD